MTARMLFPSLPSTSLQTPVQSNPFRELRPGVDGLYSGPRLPNLQDGFYQCVFS